MSNMCGVLCAAYVFDVLYITCVSGVLCASCFLLVFCVQYV